jgi:hypothetical protein
LLIDAFVSDPFLRFLHDAPVDDEPVTAEEEAAIAEVERDRAAGVPTIPFDEGQAPSHRVVTECAADWVARYRRL